MNRLIFIFILCFSLPAAAKINVVTTTTDLGAVAKAVGGDRVSVTALAAFNEDPHYVDPRPDKVLLLNKADLLIAVGLQLEQGWLPPLQKQARNPKVAVGGADYFEAATAVKTIDAQNEVDRSMGDVHPGGNPHFMFDPRAATFVANAIRDRLIALDPDGKETFSKNAKALNSTLVAIAKKQKIRFSRLPVGSRNVVAYHKSLGYLNGWLGLNEVATIEPKPGVPPNPKHVAKVLSAMKKASVKVVIQESFYPQKTAKTLAKIGKANVVVLPGGTRFPKQSYSEHIEEIANEVYDALSQ